MATHVNLYYVSSSYRYSKTSLNLMCMGLNLVDPIHELKCRDEDQVQGTGNVRGVLPAGETSTSRTL
jgi:hypothetical protein